MVSLAEKRREKARRYREKLKTDPIRSEINLIKAKERAQKYRKKLLELTKADIKKLEERKEKDRIRQRNYRAKKKLQNQSQGNIQQKQSLAQSESALSFILKEISGTEENYIKSYLSENRVEKFEVDYRLGDFKSDIEEPTSTSMSSFNIQIKKEETLQDTNIAISKTYYPHLFSPSCKSQKLKQLSIPSRVAQRTQSNVDVELPCHVKNFKDALLLLKPIEEYAMLMENYRAIGLITQLEEVLKKAPRHDEFTD